MVGAIISWGIAWPLLRNRAGDWYPANLANPANNFQGEFAYHVSACVAEPPHPDSRPQSVTAATATPPTWSTLETPYRGSLRTCERGLRPCCRACTSEDSVSDC
jgi:hypothetical protein